MPAHGPYTQITLFGARLAKSQQTGAAAHNSRFGTAPSPFLRDAVQNR
jgi:hypothetical protein